MLLVEQQIENDTADAFFAKPSSHGHMFLKKFTYNTRYANARSGVIGGNHYFSILGVSCFSTAIDSSTTSAHASSLESISILFLD